MQAFDHNQAQKAAAPNHSHSAHKQVSAALSASSSNRVEETRDPLQAPERASDRPILSFKQLAEHRMNDLRQLYKAHGVTLESDEDLLQQIRADWRLHKQYAELATTTAHSLSEPTPITLEVDGRRYHLFGVVHSWSTGRRYQDAFGASIAQFQDVVAEQGMRMYFRLPPGSISCADWAPIRLGELFTFMALEAFDIRRPLAIIAGFVLPFQRREAEQSTAQACEFLNDVDGLPDQIARELQVVNGMPLNFIQRRSQYQAEFAKCWGSSGECALLVGGLHATEIRDYLTYGVDAPEIRELARLHATMAREHPLRYKALYAYYWAKESCVGMLAIAVGFSPWLGAALGLRYWFF